MNITININICSYESPLVPICVINYANIQWIPGNGLAGFDISIYNDLELPTGIHPLKPLLIQHPHPASITKAWTEPGSSKSFKRDSDTTLKPQYNNDWYCCLQCLHLAAGDRTMHNKKCHLNTCDGQNLQPPLLFAIFFSSPHRKTHLVRLGQICVPKELGASMLRSLRRSKLAM
jgi:hypothetical protein